MLRLFPLFAALFCFSMIIVISCAKSQNTHELHEIELKKIEFTDANIKRYSFLEEVKNKTNKTKSLTVIPPQVFISDNKINRQQIVVVGIRSSFSCGTAGCSYSFFTLKNGDYEMLQTITFHGLYKAKCEKEYIVLGGGGGSGITHPVAGVWNISKYNMNYLGSVHRLNINDICNLAKEKSDEQ